MQHRKLMTNSQGKEETKKGVYKFDYSKRSSSNFDLLRQSTDDKSTIQK